MKRENKELSQKYPNAWRKFIEDNSWRYKFKLYGCDYSYYSSEEVIKSRYEKSQQAYNDTPEDLGINRPVLAIAEALLTEPKRFKQKKLEGCDESVVRDTVTGIHFTYTMGWSQYVTLYTGYRSCVTRHLKHPTFTGNEAIFLGNIWYDIVKVREDKVHDYLQKRRERESIRARKKLCDLYEG